MKVKTSLPDQPTSSPKHLLDIILHMLSFSLRINLPLNEQTEGLDITTHHSHNISRSLSFICVLSSSFAGTMPPSTVVSISLGATLLRPAEPFRRRANFVEEVDPALLGESARAKSRSGR